ncbi:MAG: PAS domain S-box protein [Desulfobacteraceae bacterium]|nr:MAG: PAS domain S-box protein [Desulfobacteraceae bacterium]
MKNPLTLISEMGIRRRVFFLLVVVLVPLLLVQGFTFHRSYRESKEAVMQSNLELARSVSKTFHAFINDVLHTQLAIGLAATACTDSDDSLRVILQAAEETNPMLRSFTWSTPDGASIVTTNTAVKNPKIRAQILVPRLVSGEDHGVSDLYDSPDTGEKVFVIGRGIRDSRGDLLGIISCVCMPGKLDPLLAVQRAKGTAISLLDSKGILVYRYPAAKRAPAGMNRLQCEPIIWNALERKEVSAEVYGPQDERRLAAFVPVPSIGWVAGSSRAEHEVTKSITQALLPHALFMSLITLAAFGIAVVLLRPISRSIRRLEDHAVALGQGEVERIGKVHGPREIENLSDAFNDMAEKVRSREQALRESEQKFRALFENSQEAVFLTGPDGAVTAANPFACTMLGYSEEEICTLGRAGVLDPEDPRMSAALEERQRKGHVRARELTAIRRSGEKFPVEVDSVILQDEPHHSFVIMRDITERKRTERTLRQKEEAVRRSLDQLRSVLNIMSEGVLILDGEGRILLVNPAMIRLAGWDQPPRSWKEYENLISMSELSGRTLPFEQWPASRALRGESLRDLEYRVHRFDSSKEYIAAYSGTPVLNAEGAVELVVVTVRDITARKRDEEELRRAKESLELRVRERTAELEWKNEELRNFTFAASHDLQEPLRKIQMISDLLASKYSDSVNEKGRDYIRRLHETATRMRGVLQSLIKYSRLISKTEPLCRVDLNEIAKEVVSDLELQIRETGASVDIGNLPEIEADAGQMRQLFQNLLSNALKFRREGVRPDIRINSEHLIQENKCRIHVSDNGIGFEEKYLESIFKPFKRLHGREEYGGMGMGLAICSKVVEQHNGSITAKSIPGKGSTFTLTLPLLQKRQADKS